MTREEFRKLCVARWHDVVHVFPELGEKVVPIEFGHYEHFDSPRGFGVTFCEEIGECSMRYPPKLLAQHRTRIDGVLRHELGHVVDHLLPPRRVNDRGRTRGLSRIAATPERRADDVALLIWGTPLRYDEELVQNTSVGVHPRPRHLGL